MALVRCWKNGSLIGEFPDRITLKTDGTLATAAYIFTYWNGSAPKDQELWIDDIVLTTNTPSNIDQSGNNFIGMENISRPEPPSNILILDGA